MKKIIAFSGLMFISAIANASVLLWQVSSEEVSSSYSGVGGWDSARLYAFGGTIDSYPSLSGATAVNNVGYVSENTYKAFDPATTLVGPSTSVAYVADISAFSDSSYSFFVELWNSETSQRVGFSQIQTVAANETPNYVYTDTSAITAALSPSSLANIGVWHGGNYGPVPEPTSAILMLFGAAFLGLKRKNRSLA